MMSMSRRGKKTQSHKKKTEVVSSCARPPPCHKIWMSRKVISVCRQPKCSTGLKKQKKTRCICLEICFPGRTSGVSERAAAAAACVSSKREGERADTLIISQATMCSSTCSNLHAQPPLWRPADVPRDEVLASTGRRSRARREAEEWKYSAPVHTIRV